MFSIGLCLFVLLSFASCQNGSDSKKVESDKKEKKEEAATQATINVSELEKALSQCVKVEYMLYDLGVSFESPSNNEVARYYSYIVKSKADESKCGSNYDGGVVFKDEEGDIKLSMDINIPQLKGCNRMAYTIDGVRYAHPFNKDGLNFFNQILQMQQGAAQGGGN